MITDSIKIERLAERPSCIPTLAMWTQKEWGRQTPDVTYEMRVSWFSQMVSATPSIPEAFVAIVDDAPVGMASIVEHDMQTRMELTPWLAAVYVVPAFRNQGIGSLLVREAMQEAAELGVSRLFLFTPDRMSFYHRLGWREQEVVSYRGEQVTIMSYDIPANT